jgi:hypothetical protein
MQSRRRTGKLFRLSAVLAAAALAIVSFAAGSQEAVAIPGTLVTLTPPPGFKVAGRGLDNGAGSTITISERSAEGYAELAATFSSAKNLSAAYAAQGVTIRAVRQISVPAGQALFAAGTQSFRGRNTIRYFALLKGDKTVLITFNLADRSFAEADAETLLRSVSLGSAPTVDEQLARLAFTFEVIEPFHVANVIDRNTVTLEMGDDDRPASSRPAVVIGRGQSQAVMGDEARVAVELLKNTAGFREATVTSERPVTFGGGAGYAITAVVAERTVVQYLRIVPGGAYLRLLARGPTAAMQEAEAPIAAIADSVEPR